MKNLSLSSRIFLITVLLFGALTYLLFGEIFYYRLTGRGEERLFFSFPTKVDSENRAKAKFPSKLDARFPKDFDIFFNDAFPFRSKLIKRFFKLRVLLSDNPNVIPGKENWFFYNSSSLDIYKKTNNTLGDFTGKTLLNDTDKETFTRHMACQKKFFDGLGMQFVIMTPPNRKPVYPEHLPERYRNQGVAYGRYEQVADILKSLGIDFVDEKAALINNKDKGELYYKTDTHWTFLGAHYGFAALAKHFGYDFPPVVSVNRTTIECGDMYRMSASLVKTCADVSDTPVLPPVKAEGKCDLADTKRVVCENAEAPVQKSVVIVRDSMFDFLYPQVARTFKKTLLLWRSKHTERELAEEIKASGADAVIYEQGERFMLEMQNEAICPDDIIKVPRLDQRPPADAQKGREGVEK